MNWDYLPFSTSLLRAGKVIQHLFYPEQKKVLYPKNISRKHNFIASPRSDEDMYRGSCIGPILCKVHCAFKANCDGHEVPGELWLAVLHILQWGDTSRCSTDSVSREAANMEEAFKCMQDNFMTLYHKEHIVLGRHEAQGAFQNYITATWLSLPACTGFAVQSGYGIPVTAFSAGLYHRGCKIGIVLCTLHC